MKIKFDYQIFVSQKYGGISKYFTNLNKLLKLENCRPIIVAPLYRNQYLKSEIHPNNKIGLFLNFQSKIGVRILRYINFLLDYLISIFSNYQIIHLTYFSVISKSYIQPNSKLVITIFDMTYEKYPKLFKHARKTIKNKKKLIEKADAIICISQNTKKDLLAFYDLNINKVNVIYLGVDLSIFFKDNSLKYRLHKKNFILYVGNRGGYKNFNILLEVFSKNKIINDNYDLLLFGGEIISSSDLKRFENLKVKNKIAHVSGDDNLLSKYYNQASIFVNTSLYEGFGMTILEAMACECPVIAGNNSSIPEISGNSCCLIDMTKKEDLLYALNKLLNDTKYRDKIIKSGLQNLDRFKWSDTSRLTYNLYKSLI